MIRNNIVETTFEAALSPRCRDRITWDDNHVGGFVEPTQKHIPTDEEGRQSITSDDRAELAEFDKRAKARNS